MLKVARHIKSALHWVVPHWGTLMELCVWGHSLCFQLLFSAKHTGCSIYIFLRRDKNSVNISPRSSCSALGSPAFPWLCGGWCALIVTTVARNSSKQSLNCHQIEIWMSFNWEGCIGVRFGICSLHSWKHSGSRGKGKKAEMLQKNKFRIWSNIGFSAYSCIHLSEIKMRLWHWIYFWFFGFSETLPGAAPSLNVSGPSIGIPVLKQTHWHIAISSLVCILN